MALQTERDGWLNPKISDYFTAYARLCFDRFGDRVKHWITFNEPWVVAILGYGQGQHAPGRNSHTEAYLAGHQILISHAKTVKLFKEEFAHQNGTIGITNNCDWREPLTEKEEDKAAAQRALEFFLAWFTDPIYKGDYPSVMKDRLGDRLPQFTIDEKKMLMGSSDFFGLNHYTTMYAADAHGHPVDNIKGNGGISEDQDVALSDDPSWKKTSMDWAVVPWGCRKLIEWITERYDAPPIYITENGFAINDTVEDGLVDDSKTRLTYYKSYIEACHEAIQNGVNLKGYFAWSMFDNFEWSLGYSQRFGLNYIDYETLERIPKESAKWFTKLIENNAF